jgi:hypothetical protein
VVKAYEDDLRMGEFQAAWALLARQAQNRWGTLDNFQADRLKFRVTAGTKFSEELDPTNTLTISQWIEGRNWTGIDLSKAHLVSIHWDAFTDPMTGWEIFVVMPTKTGWAIYQVK